jgi:hypothetical protein
VAELVDDSVSVVEEGAEMDRAKAVGDKLLERRDVLKEIS